MFEDTAWNVPKAMSRLRRGDRTLKQIVLTNSRHIDSSLVKLIDCLLAHSNVVTRLLFADNQMTDETVIKVAQFMAASSTLQVLSLAYIKLSEASCLALAEALCANSSMQHLYLYYGKNVDQARFDAAFVRALRLNPDRPSGSILWVYARHAEHPYIKTAVDVFGRLKQAAVASGPPSMLFQLRQCDRTRTKTKIREICFFLKYKNVASGGNYYRSYAATQ